MHTLYIYYEIVNVAVKICTHCRCVVGEFPSGANLARGQGFIRVVMTDDPDKIYKYFSKTLLKFKNLYHIVKLMLLTLVAKLEGIRRTIVKMITYRWCVYGENLVYITSFSNFFGCMCLSTYPPFST